MILNYFKQKWKDGLNIGRQKEIHYLERQRIATLNAVCWVLIVLSVIICTIYSMLDYSNRLTPLYVIPPCAFAIWLNYKQKYVVARNIAFFGVMISVTIWCFHDRKIGTHLLYIALANGSVSVFQNRKNAYIGMIICCILFFFYVGYDFMNPFTFNKNINYYFINTAMAFVAGLIIFFQAIINADISANISKKLDKNFNELSDAFENQKISDEKLKIANSELYDFNQKLDFLVKKSVGELQSYQTAIDDNLSSVVTNYDGIILKINELYLQKTGYQNNEIIGKNIDIIKSDFHNDAFYEEINTTLIAGLVWRGESKIKTKNGENLWFSSSILPIKDSNGKIIKFLTISADITDKIEAEQNEEIAVRKLSKSEKRLGLLLEHQTDLITITDKEGNRKYVNRSFANFFGKTQDFFINTNYRTLNPENVDNFYLKIFDSISFENPKITTTIVRENATGQKRWIKWDEIAFFNENKEVTEILSIGHDITEMKENEFQNANYIAQFEELAFKNSHHFRKPLSNIMGVINLIDGQSSENEIAELLNIIKNEITDLDSSSQELSNFINIHSKNNKHNGEIFNTDFIDAKHKHLKWRYKIKQFLEGKGNLPEIQAVSAKNSELGKWLYDEGKMKYGHLESVQKMELQHKKLHDLVAEIMTIRKTSQKEIADEKFSKLTAISDKIILLLDETEHYINNKNATVES